jgi:4-amino-4-deoxy-L-arabinose transferase-like glycosyltransferase
VYERFVTPRVLVAVFALIIVLNVFCLGRYPAIGGDDVIMGSTALNFVNHETLARPIQHGAGFPVVDCMPPVTPLVIAASYAVFGFGVIQTKLPGLILGVATAVLLFAVTTGIAGQRPAVIATLVFILDPVTFTTWQTGRTEGPFVFAVAASIFTAYLTIGMGKGRREIIWFLVGVLTGIAGAAYYPFAAVAVLISLLSLWALVWCDRGLRLRDRLTMSAGFVAGLAVVIIAMSVWVYAHLAYCREQILGMAPNYLGGGFRSQFQVMLGEWRRYWDYATREAGFPNLMLGIVSIAMIPRVARRRWELALPFIGAIGAIAFLSIYEQKDSRYLGTLVLLGCIGLAVLYREIDSGAFPNLGLWLVKPLICLSIVVGILRAALVTFTLIYQWQGRDFRTFDAEVRALIPHDARVIGPQTIFYALADEDADLWLYTQGEPRFARQTGEDALNDPNVLAHVTHIVIDERETANRLQGLRDYVRTNFRLLAAVRPTFAPLPWARIAPLDVEIYARAGKRN